jgi:hypothetical protein
MAGSITAFLRKLESQKLNNDELDVIDTFISHIYDTYGLPRAGCVPQVTLSNSSFVPVYERRFIGMDPLRNTIMRHYANIAKLPLRGKSDWEYDQLNESSFECNNTKLLSHLTALGYLEQEKLSTFVYGQPGLELLLKEYANPDPQIYRYNIVYNLPSWIVDFSVV